MTTIVRERKEKQNKVKLRETEGDGLAGEGLDEDLHSIAETEDQVECALLLDVVIDEGAAVFELLAGEDKPLLARGDSFLVPAVIFHRN